MCRMVAWWCRILVGNIFSLQLVEAFTGLGLLGSLPQGMVHNGQEVEL